MYNYVTPEWYKPETEGQSYQVVTTFSVPRSFVESKTVDEWVQIFVDNSKLDQETIDETEWNYEEVAKVLAVDYIGAGDFVSGWEMTEIDTAKTWEE